jgi:hypothetical protein
MSTLAKVFFDYGILFTKEQQEQIKDLAFDAPFNVKEEPTSLWCSVVMLVEDAVKFGSFKVEKILPYNIIDKITLFEQRKTSVVNEKCNVIVNGLGTLSIDTVKIMCDCCTEKLNDELERGWRIVAVCVQPDQRRPDYVLGKTINN